MIGDPLNGNAGATLTGNVVSTPTGNAGGTPTGLVGGSLTGNAGATQSGDEGITQPGTTPTGSPIPLWGQCGGTYNGGASGSCADGSQCVCKDSSKHFFHSNR